MNSNPTALTMKQMTILKVVLAGNGLNAGELIPVDMDELLERIDYKTTKNSMHFSLRALIKRGFVFKAGKDSRRGRFRVLIAPTELARSTMSSSISDPSFLVSEEEDLHSGDLSDLLKS